jgi:hypothetical protein
MEIVEEKLSKLHRMEADFGIRILHAVEKSGFGKVV